MEELLALSEARLVMKTKFIKPPTTAVLTDVPENSDIAEWNRIHPIGTLIRIDIGDGKPFDGRIRHRAMLHESGKAVVWIEDKAGCYYLDDVTPLTNHTKQVPSKLLPPPPSSDDRIFQTSFLDATR